MVGKSVRLHNITVCPSIPVIAVGDSQGSCDDSNFLDNLVVDLRGVVHCLKLSPNLRRGPPEPDRRGEEESIK